jgi:hypothetical protein
VTISKTSLLTPVLLCALTMFFGCASTYVVPNRVQAPFLKSQGDIHVDAAYGTSGLVGGIAFSPFQNIAMKGSYAKSSGRQQRDHNEKLTDISNGHALTEMAFGYYVPSLSYLHEKATIQFYLGTTLGTVRAGATSTIFSPSLQVVDARSQEEFIECIVGFAGMLKPLPDSRDTLGSFYEYGSAVRLSEWKLTSIVYNGILSPGEQKLANFLQVTIFGRVPGRVAFLEGQVGWMFRISDHPNPPGAALMFVSAGIHFNIFPSSHL